MVLIAGAGMMSASFALAQSQPTNSMIAALEAQVNDSCPPCGGTLEECCKSCKTPACKDLNEIGFKIGRDEVTGKYTVESLQTK